MICDQKASSVPAVLLLLPPGPVSPLGSSCSRPPSAERRHLSDGAISSRKKLLIPSMLKCLEKQISFVLHDWVGFATFTFRYTLDYFYRRLLKVVFYTSAVLQPVISGLLKAASWSSSTIFSPHSR